MEERVSISISEGVADVRLVRADRMNALDQAMFEALVAATERLSKEKACAPSCCRAKAAPSAPVSTWGVLPP